ncbi:transcription repressor NadR [Vallitalea maricola]|uniref:Transcription repressor NadR n=1 Tax=Vallitalea maricola TaxID=3074433 RepID=A0ACB5UQM9_9FIRM|nr:transcription repressor NadR [Vallitalea sp. AN17-2]
MEGLERRNNIKKLLTESAEPITGSRLAKTFSVSRQVIVQDIALLRAKGCKIISTSNGYMIYESKKEYTKLLAVKHTKEDIREELETIVDFGATIVNVMVIHPVYGEITANLMLSSRKHIDDFIKKLQKDESIPLMRLKNGEHYHLIKANNNKTLELVEKQLQKKGFLI